jgi:hypothetical protein
MKDEEIELNTAILAWKKGFPKKLGKITQSLLQRWLRETHGLHIHLYFIDNVLGYQATITDIISNIELFESKCFVPYEQALEEGLYKALELIKTK